MKRKRIMNSKYKLILTLVTLIGSIATTDSIWAKNSQKNKRVIEVSSNESHRNHGSLESVNSRRFHFKPHRRKCARFPFQFRTIDGTYNNLGNPKWGSADGELLRLTTLDYADGVDAPAGENRPSAREISNTCNAQYESRPNPKRASDFFWQWGQFLDHDIDLTPTLDPPEMFDIQVPKGDPDFDPFSLGNVTIPFDRSFYTIVNGVREQINEITAYIDASNVYGSKSQRALELRTLDGTGRLQTSEGELLPFNVNGFPNAPTSEDPSYFLAGDFRANEQVGLTAMHTLFVREHNFWARKFAKLFRRASGDTIYQLARAIVAAEMQVITYNEFLPTLLGPNALAPYQGYRPDVNSGIANIFSTAAYRFGHSMLPNQILRINQSGKPISAGPLLLADAFFSPRELIDNGGIAPVLRGLASQVAQDIDPYVDDGVRNFLFGPPGAGGLDLASLNIQRGRDHGLPSYNQVRIDCDLPPVTDFAEISSDPVIQSNLAAVYGNVESIDIWVGGLAEDHFRDALVGETFFTILKDQFERLRDGDRFWFESYLPRHFVHLVEKQTLAKIIRRNTSIGKELQRNVFIVSNLLSNAYISPAIE